MAGFDEGIGRFLDSVALVAELEASDAALATACHRDLIQLAGGETARVGDATDRIARELVVMGVLRRDIAREIANIREREGLQVLGERTSSAAER